MTWPRRWAAVLALIVGLLLLAAHFRKQDQPDDTDMATNQQVEPDVSPVNTVPARPSAIPEAKLQSALPAACSGAPQEDDFGTRSEAASQAAMDSIDGVKQILSDRLSVSSSADHLHAAALLESDPGLRIELLERAIAINPDDRFLLWSAVQICSGVPGTVGCPLREWEQRLITIDGQNSEAWVQIAANRYAAGEHELALAAMRHAASAPESEAYLSKTIELMERGIAASTEFPFPRRAFTAFGLAASQPPRYGSYVTMCREASARSVDWAYACLAYGELLETQGRLELGVSMAISIQQLALEALGDEQAAADADHRLQARHDKWRSLFENRKAGTERLIFLSPTLFSTYLATISSHGEHAAERYLAKEAERLLEQEPELACAPI